MREKFCRRVEKNPCHKIFYLTFKLTNNNLKVTAVVIFGKNKTVCTLVQNP